MEVQNSPGARLVRDPLRRIKGGYRAPPPAPQSPTTLGHKADQPPITPPSPQKVPWREDRQRAESEKGRFQLGLNETMVSGIFQGQSNNRNFTMKLLIRQNADILIISRNSKSHLVWTCMVNGPYFYATFSLPTTQSAFKQQQRSALPTEPQLPQFLH